MGCVHKHPYSVLEHCVSLLPSLVVHHHLTKVIMIGKSQILGCHNVTHHPHQGFVAFHTGLLHSSGKLSHSVERIGPAVSYHVQQYSNTAPKLSLLLL